MLHVLHWLKPRYTESRSNRNSVDPSHRSRQYPANVPFYNRDVHTCAHFCCRVVFWDYRTGALWDLRNGHIACAMPCLVCPQGLCTLAHKAQYVVFFYEMNFLHLQADHIECLEQGCGSSIANRMRLLRSCTNHRDLILSPTWPHIGRHVPCLYGWGIRNSLWLKVSLKSLIPIFVVLNVSICRIKTRYIKN